MAGRRSIDLNQKVQELLEHTLPVRAGIEAPIRNFDERANSRSTAYSRVSRTRGPLSDLKMPIGPFVKSVFATGTVVADILSHEFVGDANCLQRA